MNTELFRIYHPETEQIKGLISIPHAGEFFPKEFIPFLTNDKRALAEDVDYKVDELVDIKRLQETGIVVLVANVHRTCLDLNRPAQKACLNWKNNTQGVELVTKEPSDEKIKQLTLKYHTPYFNKLTELIEKHTTAKRKLPVIDLHSMPSRPTQHHLKQNPDQKMERADTCISDWNGKSCSTKYINNIISFLQSMDVSAAKNDPYYGGYLTQYMSPLECENVQIEINRSIYMDEVKRELISQKVEHLRPILTELAIKLFTDQL